MCVCSSTKRISSFVYCASFALSEVFHVVDLLCGNLIETMKISSGMIEGFFLSVLPCVLFFE